METNMFKNLLERASHRSCGIALSLFTLIALVHFTAAFLKSLALNFAGMILFALISLTLVKKRYWQEIRIRKPIYPIYILWGIMLSILFVLVSYVITYITDFNPLNFMVIMAKQQLSYGVITKYNTWQYFPIAALGFCTISPLTEEFFFRGLLLKSFENKFGNSFANILQAFLFGLIHLAYFWLTLFDIFLIATVVPLMIFGGIIYGWVTQRTNSVFSSIIVHAFCNFVLILLVFAFIIPAIG
ncbi:MAG: CPBP family intramembrane metalloprotease [Actinobacteria bacterium]|nr:CPBP family intramembrane metalloprotease [Actinomycetota bacterium]